MAYTSLSSFTFSVPGTSAGTLNVRLKASANGGSAGTPASASVPASSTVQPPIISNFSPLTARMGEAVTITGNNFIGATAVKFGTVAANFTVLSKTSINVTVPAGTAATCQLSVTTSSGTATSTATFTLDTSAAPVTSVTNMMPTQGPAGTSLVLSGTKFGSSGATVKLNGITATVTAQTDTSLTVTVPAGGTGFAVVTTSTGSTATSAQQFLVTEAGSFDVNTATWGESATLAYRGLVEDDATYASSIPAIHTPGTTAAETKEVWSGNFTPQIPHFGLDIAVTNAFNVGNGTKPPGTQDFVRAGYKFATNGFVGFQWDAEDGSIGYYEVRDNGTVTTIPYYNIPILPAFRLGLSISDRSITCWLLSPIDQTVNTGGGGTKSFKANVWEVVGRTPLDGNVAYDFRATTMLASITKASIIIGSGGNDLKYFDISGGRYGYLTGVGTANYAPVKYADGTPYATGSRVFVGGSVAGASAAPTEPAVGIHTCFAAIFDLNVVDNTIRQWAKIAFKRTLSDGVERIIGDNSIQWRYVAANNTWYAYAGRWGTIQDADPLGMGISVYKVTGSVLPKGVTILTGADMSNLPRPTPGFVQDPDMMYYNGLYHFVYNINQGGTFQVHYATTPDLPDQNATWTLVASGLADTAIQEGAHFTVENGTLQIISTYAPGNGQNSKTRIYDTGQAQAGFLTQVGEWTRQDFAESPSPTHGNETAIREVDSDNSVHSAYYWFAFGGERFDNAFYSWGNFHILRASKRKNGYVWPLITLPA